MDELARNLLCAHTWKSEGFWEGPGGQRSHVHRNEKMSSQGFGLYILCEMHESTWNLSKGRREPSQRSRMRGIYPFLFVCKGGRNKGKELNKLSLVAVSRAVMYRFCWMFEGWWAFLVESCVRVALWEGMGMSRVPLRLVLTKEGDGRGWGDTVPLTQSISRLSTISGFRAMAFPLQVGLQQLIGLVSLHKASQTTNASSSCLQKRHQRPKWKLETAMEVSRFF